MNFAAKTEKARTDMITAWSFSRWSVYEECPKKLYFKVIMKLPEPSSPVLERGTAMHSLAENYLRKGGRVPAELKLITPQLKDYRARGAVPEAEFAFDRNWKPVSWFAKEAWCRVKADVTIPPVIDDKEPTLEVHDFKTGGEKKLKERAFGDYYTQLDLYSLSGLLTYPIAKIVKSSMVFIDHGVVVATDEVVKRGDEKNLKKQWEIRVKKMMADTVFKPKPGNACRFCHFRKGNGGPCSY